MAEKLEDLNLPATSVQRIIKEALPDTIIVGKDVKAAIAKAASMFILYITSQGTQIALKAKRKTLLPQDIFEALEEAEFDELLDPLHKAVKEAIENKPKKASKTDKNTSDNTEERGEEHGEEPSEEPGEDHDEENDDGEIGDEEENDE